MINNNTNNNDDNHTTYDIIMLRYRAQTYGSGREKQLNPADRYTRVRGQRQDRPGTLPCYFHPVFETGLLPKTAAAAAEAINFNPPGPARSYASPLSRGRY